MTDFNEYFTHTIIEMQKETFSNPTKTDMLNKIIADLWVWKASLRISEENDKKANEAECLQGLL